MSALQRAGGSASLKLLIALVLLALLGGAGTFALSQATTISKAGTSGAASDQQNFKNHALYAPTNVAAAVSAASMVLTWTDAAGTSGDLHGNGNGYAIKAYHYGAASGSCSTTLSDYSTFVASTPDTGTTYTDSTSDFGGGGSSTYLASYSCYLVQTWYVAGNPSTGSNWTSATVPQWTSTTASVTTTAVQEGFVADTASMTATTQGTPAPGDKLIISYNQATTAPNLLSLNVCFHTASTTVYVGQIPWGTGITTCDTAGGSSVGTLTGGTFTSTSSKDGTFNIDCPTSGVAASCWTNSNKTLTIVLGPTFTGKAPASFSTGWTLTPSQGPQTSQVLVKTSATTSIAPCNLNHTVVEGAGAGTSQTNVCNPAASGRF